MNKKGEKDKNMRNKGITLIALVITIIVLLILAGVTIAILTGENGILTRASDAKTSTEIAEEREKVELAATVALADDLGGEIKESFLKQELEKYFGADGVSVAPGENNGVEGFIVTIDDSGRQYLVDKDGNVSEMIPGPTVTYSISPDTQVGDGEKITITITATATEGEVTKITLPDGSTVENATTATYEVEENGDYVFTVEQSNGGKTVYTVPITNGKEVEKFSDIYGSTTEYKENGVTVAWIPAGFAVGVSSTIDEVSEGLVITDAIDSNHKSIGNEFVWVPVESFDEFKRYDFQNNTEISSSYTEPSADGITENTEVEKMYKSIKDYGGFYVGRYEAGEGDNENVLIQKGKEVYNYVSWTKADELARSVYLGEDSVTSTLTYGVQWDAIMRWMQDVKNENVEGEPLYIQNSTGMGWYSDNYVSGNATNQTGIDLDEGKNKVKNIYDLAGNVVEWTMESYRNTSRRVYRGGGFCYSGSNNPASERNYDWSSSSNSSIGFRVTLYVK